MKTKLVVALDYSNLDQAEDLINQLTGLSVIYKVGMDLFLAAGPDWIRLLSDSGEQVLLELNLHDIPHIVGQAVLKACELKTEFLTVHLTGGNMMLDEVQRRLSEVSSVGPYAKKPQILGVSLFPFFEEQDWKSTVQKISGNAEPRSIEESVLEFSALAHQHQAVDGMICSPHELSAIRQKYPDLFLMVPGIRPKGTFKHDQQWVMTPQEAARAGASAIIVGRPIIQAEDSRQMTESILAELEAA